MKQSVFRKYLLSTDVFSNKIIRCESSVSHKYLLSTDVFSNKIIRYESFDETISISQIFIVN
jgi:hypothetical protein